VINIPQKEEYNEGYNFIVDNSGAGGSAQLTQIAFTYPNSQTQIVYNVQSLPLTVGEASRMDLPFNLSVATPGLPAKSYVISGEATFLKFNGPMFAYVTSPFSVTVNAGSIWTSLFPWVILILIILAIASALALILHHQQGSGRKHRY